MYIRMMGSAGIRQATVMAILNANYIARRLKGHYDVLYTGEHGRVGRPGIPGPRPLRGRATRPGPLVVSACLP